MDHLEMVFETLESKETKGQKGPDDTYSSRFTDESKK